MVHPLDNTGTDVQKYTGLLFKLTFEPSSESLCYVLGKTFNSYTITVNQRGVSLLIQEYKRVLMRLPLKADAWNIAFWRLTDTEISVVTQLYFFLIYPLMVNQFLIKAFWRFTLIETRVI